MPLFVWDESYSVKIRQFDEQHKKLIDMVNRLYEAMRNGEGSKVIADVLASLAAYTQTHFSNEERVMKLHGYPGYVSHKAIHDKLVAQVLDYQKKAETEANTLSPGVMVFLKDWLVQHIQGVDMKYGPFLSGKGVV
ncbi:MAG: hemerythrin family protein [Deltaproteobacteria bacterium]|nr:hemerythrin family protein [Deltaproteobacteria bacterium]